MRLCAVAFMALTVSACTTHRDTRSQTAAASEDSSHPLTHPEVQIGQYGTACLTFRDRDHPSNLSYRVDDLGKMGVLSLTDTQAKLVKRIQNFVHRETLRFTFVRGRILVFDATDGPCADFAPGYWIMNETDTYFEPGEAPGFLGPGPTEVGHTPGPWMHKDRP